jgi:signal transduction histidine kinase/CheY-like chemotaxis protein
MLGGRRRVIAVVRDITERLGQEAALRMGEERFSHVVKASPVGMQFFRLEEDGRLRLAGANPAADKLLGVDHSKLMGRSIEEAFPSTEGSGFVEHLCGTARSGTPLRMEMVDPREGMGQGAFEVIATRSEPGMVVVMYLDITERRKAEQERLRVEILSQEAQRLESLGMMASGVAHDFNNVLQAIRGQVDVLESRYAAPETSETFGDLSSSIQHAADLCRQLLAYSGKGHVRLEELDLGKLVRETGKVAMFGSKKKVEWDFEVSEPSPRVRGDATQLRQVGVNLLVNAVEALPREGGKVRARLRVEDLPRPEEGLAPGPAARLEVSDNGCGMSEESLARLFEPFYTTKVTGRGLGLAAVQGILRAHQGVIRVVSRVGEGTTMTVWLPALAGKAEVMENPKTTMGAFQGRALLVDDEADVRRVTHRMLERLGIEVTAAGDGASGIAAFQENKDSVVGALLDLTMPDMDGLEVYRRLLETRPDLPALLISGMAWKRMRERLKSFPRMVLLQKTLRSEGVDGGAGKYRLAESEGPEDALRPKESARPLIFSFPAPLADGSNAPSRTARAAPSGGRDPFPSLHGPFDGAEVLGVLEGIAPIKAEVGRVPFLQASQPGTFPQRLGGVRRGHPQASSGAQAATTQVLPFLDGDAKGHARISGVRPIGHFPAKVEEPREVFQRLSISLAETLLTLARETMVAEAAPFFRPTGVGPQRGQDHEAPGDGFLPEVVGDGARGEVGGLVHPGVKRQLEVARVGDMGGHPFAELMGGFHGGGGFGEGQTGSRFVVQPQFHDVEPHAQQSPDLLLGLEAARHHRRHIGTPFIGRVAALAGEDGAASVNAREARLLSPTLAHAPFHRLERGRGQVAEGGDAVGGQAP